MTLVRQRINPNLIVGGIVLCMHESATRLAGEVVDDLTGFLETARGTDVPWADAKIYETCIRRNIKLAECASFGQTVFDYASRSNGAADYARLAAEVFGDRSTIESDASEPVTSHEETNPAEVISRDSVDAPANEISTHSDQSKMVTSSQAAAGS